MFIKFQYVRVKTGIMIHPCPIDNVFGIASFSPTLTENPCNDLHEKQPNLYKCSETEGSLCGH